MCAEEDAMCDGITLDGNERISTFGGESWIDDVRLEEYGIDFEKVHVCGLTTKQMVALACVMVDHLILNGHRFELRKKFAQDQVVSLVPL